MEMQQLETMQQLRFTQAVEHRNQFVGVQTKQAAVTAVLAPVTFHFGGQLQPHADQRVHAQGAAAFDDDGHFGQGLKHKKAFETQFARLQAQIDELDRKSTRLNSSHVKIS